jgi:hypothetical protein
VLRSSGLKWVHSNPYPDVRRGWAIAAHSHMI